MNTPDFEMTAKGIGLWLSWKALHVAYLLCAALPMALYIACLLVVAIERRSIIELPIIMAVMLHPTIAIPISTFANFTGQYLSSKLFQILSDTSMVKGLQRVLTYSLNVHLAIIAGLTYYLYAIWIPLELTSTLNFENLSFDQCLCEELAMNNITCTNKETENSFQNFFIGVPIPPFLIAFLGASISCHLVHSLIPVFPAPINLHIFFLGKIKACPKIEPASRTRKEEKSMLSRTNKAVVASLMILIFGGIMSSPFYLFDAHLEKGWFKS